MNPKVDWFFDKETQWQDAYKQLRTIILDCELVEELKWGQPCYTHEGRNIVLMHGFNEYCALLFPKGVLMDDPKGILIQQTENVQSARQVRFTSLQEIRNLESTLKSYIHNAIEVEKSGAKVEFKETKEFFMSEELKEKFDEMPELKQAFEALTPGRQRGYLLHFSAPKQSKTREARIEKCVPQILEGKGLND